MARRFTNVVATCLLASAGTAAFAANLAVSVDNITEHEGVLRIAVYDAANWLDEDPGKLIAGTAYDLADREGDEPVMVNFDIEPGEYAAVIYQDVNDNRVFDKNFLGIPKEPYAFSQDFKKIRRPDFEDCRFVVGEDGAAITLTLSD